MKKSGFEDFEVDSYKEGKLRVDTDKEREAFEAMERAKEVIAKQYQSILTDYMEAVRQHSSKIAIVSMIEEKYGIPSKDFGKLSTLLLIRRK